MQRYCILSLPGNFRIFQRKIIFQSSNFVKLKKRFFKWHALSYRTDIRVGNTELFDVWTPRQAYGTTQPFWPIRFELSELYCGDRTHCVPKMFLWIGEQYILKNKRSAQATVMPWSSKSYTHLISSQSLNLVGRRGTTDDVATIPFHSFLSSDALRESPNPIPVHSLMLSSHLFFCLPLLLVPFPFPCRIFFAMPEDLEMWPYHLYYKYCTANKQFYIAMLSSTIFPYWVKISHISDEWRWCCMTFGPRQANLVLIAYETNVMHTPLYCKEMANLFFGGTIPKRYLWKR